MVSIQKKFRYHCISFTRPDRARGHIECEAYRDVGLVLIIKILAY